MCGSFATLIFEGSGRQESFGWAWLENVEKGVVLRPVMRQLLNISTENAGVLKSCHLDR